MSNHAKSGDALLVRRQHLDGHRRMLIGRSLAAAFAGALPVPVLDDWLSASILRSTFRRLARDYQVDVDDEALTSLVYGKVEPPSLGKLVTDVTLLGVLARVRRKLVVVLATARRMRTAARYFTLTTLFDHYCAKLHVGLGLNGDSAMALRALMNRALAETPGGLGKRMFRRSIAAAFRASLAAPAEIVDIATAGALRRLLARRGQGEDAPEMAAAQEVDAIVEQQLAQETSFLARATRAVELQLSVQGNPYLDAVIDTFERLWREQQKV